MSFNNEQFFKSTIESLAVIFVICSRTLLKSTDELTGQVDDYEVVFSKDVCISQI